MVAGLGKGVTTDLHLPSHTSQTVAFDESGEEAAARARLNAIFDLLDRVDSPDLLVGMKISGFLSHHLQQDKIGLFLRGT